MNIWRSPNGTVRNEIDHFLINDLSITKNVEMLSLIHFPSDHRIGRAVLTIASKNKFRDYNKTRATKNIIIPLYKIAEVSKLLTDWNARLTNNKLQKQKT